ncbi:hypothetical protein [Streptomyces sp. NBC_00091]|uniref:hypothetical protein n=1 Tax=Streptomyces sp. NBC_00091 TaxID=2975648 RepID=UPI00225232BB|nr:hypothetical protein [Streptomyces sp. NBC_00091]MCX5381136.1 hypothetical protein [Streptomyces sp. NBC_00091]
MERDQRPRRGPLPADRRGAHLRVRRLNDLVGDVGAEPHTDLFLGPGHTQLPAVRAALSTYPAPGDRQAPSRTFLRAALDSAWAARHNAPNHRHVIGTLLPGLIRDTQLAVRQAESGAERRNALALQVRAEAALTAAKRRETGAAWGWWERADAVAKRLPAGYFHRVTSFGRPVMGAHGVTVAVELRTGREGARQAAHAEAEAIPSRPRRARHKIEQARAYQLDGQPDVALAMLEQAHEAAPETTRYNGFARAIVLEETTSRVPERRLRASGLAVDIGLLAA